MTYKVALPTRPGHHLIQSMVDSLAVTLYSTQYLGVALLALVGPKRQRAMHLPSGDRTDCQSREEKR